MRTKALGLITFLIIVMMALPTLPANMRTVSAQDPGEEAPPVLMEIEGYVQFIDGNMAVIDGWIVYPGDGVDFSTLALGDYVGVIGEIQENGSILAAGVTLVTPPEQQEGEEITVTGYVEALEPDIIIAGYIVAPAGAFNPSRLEVGDLVQLTGRLLASGTIQATSLIILTATDDDCDDEDNEDGTTADGEDEDCDDDGDNDDEDCEDGDDDEDATPVPNTEDGDDDGDNEDCDDDGDDDDEDCEDGDDDEDATPVPNTEDGDDDGDDDGDNEDCDDGDDDEDDEDNDTCSAGREDHPLTVRIVATYDVTAAQVGEWRCEGFGYGEIIRALELALLTGEDPDAILQRRRDGEGWGNIMKDYDVHPGDLAPGKALKDKEKEKNENKHKGKDKDKDKDKGNGKGNGKGNSDD